jgi:hypothetical protein
MTTYTLEKIDSASITKAGKKLFYRMPSEIIYNGLPDWDAKQKMRKRVKTILSLMARNGSKLWSAMENGAHQGPTYNYYARNSWRYEGEERATMLKRADEAGLEWVERWEKEGEQATRRLNELAVILSEVTGYTWTIGSELGHSEQVLVIPEGITGARPNSIHLGEGRPGISLIRF